MMKAINVREIHDKNTAEDFAEAKKCDDFLYDKDGGPATWHRCFCGAMPGQRGIPEHCNLVWRGQCIKSNNGGE